ncbi:ROK family protein [Lactonifactor longoviformis]|uniref:Sugar kinase of the NBD/HSP70 family, may contain an N-terminal HTH domain n=1 Tax=Lactonifactor longoviformis DSM 17459 TaxID=1122155 RepID=A0A1M4XU12_9CLOT|nr:ROK family protein [Lactonifactor longoviformis]POP32329.1 ROK family protein [Lactonifactor longoviformis]SHE96880.1 Sugar kinase of the NBD/HSP70 family, may contain an N-terminal HTH domain [Lactonifactor longoviformis DSM 17459]
MENRGLGTGSQKHIKDNNKKVILRLMLNQGPLTKKEISKLTKLSVVSVTSNMDELLKLGAIVEETPNEEASYGRKPMVYNVNPRFRCLISVDLGKELVDISLGDMCYHLIASDTYQITETVGAQEMMEDIMVKIETLLNRYQISPEQIGSMALANPGVVYDDSGRILKPAKMAKKWADLPLREMFQERFGCTTAVMNDIDMAALGYQALCDREELPENYLYLRVDAGLGMGVIVDGQLLKCSYGSAGEIGYATLLREDGSWETVDYETIASLSALLGSVKEKLDFHRDSSLYQAAKGEPERVTLELIAETAGKDAWLQAEISRVTTHIATIAVNGMLLLGINSVVIDGGILLLKEWFTEPFYRMLREKNVLKREPHLYVAAPYSAIYGGLQLGRNLVIEHDL